MTAFPALLTPFLDGIGSKPVHKVKQLPPGPPKLWMLYKDGDDMPDYVIDVFATEELAQRSLKYYQRSEKYPNTFYVVEQEVAKIV